MEALSIARRIADIAASQWGMVTTAQARVHGIARANLAHRVRTGVLERTDHYGVYRLAAAPSSPMDDLRAAWLSTNLEVLAPTRTAALQPDAVVASAAAAMVHGIGDVYPAPYKMIVPGRRQSATGCVAYSWRALDPRDIEVVDGLPVTTRERTIVDLLVDEGDVSIAADALRDAFRSQYDLDETRLMDLFAPHAERLGRVQGDGLGALAHLMVVAEVDAVSQASRALDRLVGSKIPLPGMEAFLNRSIEHLADLAATMPIPPALVASAQANVHLLNGSAAAALHGIVEPTSEGGNE
jgi:predicted transcriptional regulator of viral defense system